MVRRPSGQQAGQGSPFGPCVMRCCPGPAPPSRSLSAAVSEMILPTFRVAMGISWVKPRPTPRTLPRHPSRGRAHGSG